jgi:hypothetical protein
MPVKTAFDQRDRGRGLASGKDQPELGIAEAEFTLLTEAVEDQSSGGSSANALARISGPFGSVTSQ